MRLSRLALAAPLALCAGADAAESRDAALFESWRATPAEPVAAEEPLEAYQEIVEKQEFPERKGT